MYTSSAGIYITLRRATRLDKRDWQYTNSEPLLVEARFDNGVAHCASRSGPIFCFLKGWLVGRNGFCTIITLLMLLDTEDEFI